MENDNNELEAEDLLNLDEIMQAFGVSSWQNIGPADDLPGERFSLLVDIEEQRYILRERPEGPLGTDSGHRYAFQRYLQQAGLPFPAFRPTPQGELSVTVGDDAFELQRWPGGEQFASANPRSINWVAAAGSMLGQIHQASRQYPGPVHRWPAEAHIGAIVQGYLNLVRGRADEHPMQAIAVGLAEWVEQWEAVLPAAMVSLGAGRALPEFHIHGDYHALNLRFGPAAVTAVMGLEASRWEKRIFEVAYGLFYFSALAWQPGESLVRPLVRRGLDPERARRFLQAYGAVYPPTPEEAALLADALLLVSPIATMNGPLEDLFYAQEDADEALIDDVMERLTWATSLPAWINRARRGLAEMWADR